MNRSFLTYIFGSRANYIGLITGMKFDNNLTDLISNSWDFFSETMGYSTGMFSTNCVYSPHRTSLPSCIRCGSGANLRLCDESGDLPFSISLWLNWEEASTGSICDVFGKHMRARISSEAEYECSINNSTGIIQFRRYSSRSRTNYITTYSSLAINKNQWYHVAITSDGINVYIYINGVDVTGDTIITGSYIGMALATDRFSFFNSADPRNYLSTQFFGKIDSFYMWRSIQLSPTKILEIATKSTDIF